MAFFQHVANILRNESLRDLRHRLLITIGLIAVCRIGCYIPVPGVDAQGLSELASGLGAKEGLGRLLGLLNVFSGGALARAAIFGLGVMPYISASIIFQLLANVVPSLERLRKEGEAGQKKLNQYSRIATVFICLLQGSILIRGLFNYGIAPEYITSSPLRSLLFSVGNGFILTAGTMFLMWIGEQIDGHGIGSGISLIIMVNILDRLPSAIQMLAVEIQAKASQQDAILQIVALLGLFVAVIVAIIYITRGERRIPVQQAKHVRGPKVYGGQKAYLPLKVNQSGVMPLIFAGALLMFPAMIANSAAEALRDSGGFLHSMFRFIGDAVQPGGGLRITYVALQGLLIFFFAYFWTAVTFNPKDISENLKDHGSFIPGIRPGKRTADYLEGILNRITLAGSSFLVTIALMPMIIAWAMNVNLYVAGFYGGTSILIVVGVALDLVNKINQHLEMRRYSGFAAGAAGRRRARRRR